MPISGEREREQTYILQQSSKCYEHRDSVATAMSIDYTGQWVLLAGRGHLALQRLGQDEALPKNYYRNSKYGVSAAEFAICPNRQEFCAIATSQDIDIVTWGAADPRHFHSLRGHTRTVTDIDWHGKNPNLLVSCSIDTFSHIWDLRDPRKPTLSLSAVCMSGATQVGFNRVSGNLLAAAHDGDLRIWDIRKGSCPIHYITAHLNRVHGINWSHRLETCLATASQDGTVKYFDINNPRRAEKIITTSSPVWRARYTPIGNGLVSIVVPHLGRGENSLLLWSNSKQTDPICSFVGHTDVILDFAWRPNRENTTEIEIVTWSRDRTLRVWKIDETMLKLCEPPPDTESYEPNDTRDTETPTNNLSLCLPSSQETPKSGFHHPATSLPSEALDALQVSRSPPPSFRREETQVARSLTDQPTCSLHHEFSLLNTNMDVEVDVLDAIQRFAIFKISAGGHFAVLQVTFPTQYPCPMVAPNFSFLEGTTLSDHLSAVLLKGLKRSAIQCVRRSRPCLEYCLKALVTAMKKTIGGTDKSQMRLQSPRLEGALSGALHDACIPFPRTSGVCFNAVGKLTVFSQILSSKRLSLRHHNTTPRTLSAINGSGLLGNVMGPQPVLYTHRDSNSSFYLQDRISTKHSKNRNLPKSANGPPVVHVYDCSRLLNMSREMAKEFSLDKRDIIQTCRKNRQICESHGRMELVPIWSLAEMIATPNTPNESRYEALFYKNPFKKFLLEALIMHFGKAGDIQTAVMLACLFHKCSPIDGAAANEGDEGNEGLINDYQASPELKVVQHQSMMLKVKGSEQPRSNSWSESLDSPIDGNDTICADGYTCSLIPRAKMPLFDQFKRTYAEILYGWQLLTKRALVLKHTQYSEPASLNTGKRVRMRSKRMLAIEAAQSTTLLCTLCYLPVKGVASACLACDHGGHTAHMQQWFENHDICASGCGCHCLRQTALVFDYIN